MSNDEIIRTAIKLVEKYYFEDNHSNIPFNEFVEKYLDDFMIAYSKLQRHFNKD